ncbi:hypothetical protein OIU84_026832, partial [Salix udensis]
MYLWGLLLLLNVEVQRCFLSLLIVVYWLCTAAVSVLVGFRAPTAFKVSFFWDSCLVVCSISSLIL